MTIAEMKLKIIKEMILGWRAKDGQRKPPKEQGAFMETLLTIIDMRGEE